MEHFIVDGYGEPIILETNALWSIPDADYTPNMNFISAVWPKLRYKSYKVAVLNARSVDVTTYYLPTNTLSLSDPCSHPDAIKCTSTGMKNFLLSIMLSIMRCIYGGNFVLLYTNFF